MRSRAFSCLAGLSSCLARELYSSMVRWKAVREALREPSAAGLIWAAEGVACGSDEEGWLERLARSLRIEVLCLRAPLKVVFCGFLSALASPGRYYGGEELTILMLFMLYRHSSKKSGRKAATMSVCVERWLPWFICWLR